MTTRRVLAFLSTACLVAACGARTGLLIPVPSEGGADVVEEPDATEEPDVTEEPDAAMDVTSEPDAIEEDVFVPPDGPDICPDAGSTLVYVITLGNELLAFYPPTASFMTIGLISCPVTDPTDGPFSMAVDRQGTAYVVFSSGRLFRVSTKSAACGATSFIPGNAGFPTTFGMAFSADGDAGVSPDGGETLYLAGNPGGMPGTANNILGSLDVQSFQTHVIGAINPPIQGSELTGTGSGDLFGFFPLAGGTGGAAAIGQIAKGTAQLLSATSLPSIDIARGWAFGFWGGDFYTFTAPDNADTVVQRYRPSDGTVVTVATLSGQVVVGAGVSTCAPQM